MNKKIVSAFSELISRATIGWVFIESGWGKFHDLPKVVSYFESLNIPFAQWQAPVVSALELISGLFVLFGFYTRLSSLPLVAIMVVAIVTAKREELNELSVLFGLSEFLYIVILLGLVAGGSKFLSIDAGMTRKTRRDS